jgi:hypothetical protein
VSVSNGSKESWDVRHHEETETYFSELDKNKGKLNLKK